MKTPFDLLECLKLPDARTQNFNHVHDTTQRRKPMGWTGGNTLLRHRTDSTEAVCHTLIPSRPDRG